ncbi:MAG TPA: hemolysin family protein [Xanthobacteraceae bacterium]|nr:hemolysin family protein [Xanthobacteraceae bacterium]
MPDSDAANRGNEPTRNLPIPVPRPNDVARDGESWLGRLMRSLFGWKTGSIRADLETVLGSEASALTGFSPAESRMLRNILELRERRVDDVMLPRADIVAVQQDTTLGELVKIFESAAHSRLVVYGDTLDDPMGIVHIRDLVAFMAKHAAVPPKLAKRRKKPTEGLDFKSVDLSMPLAAAGIMRPLLYIPPSMPAIDLLAKMQATRIHLALVIDEYGGTDGLVSIEDIVEQIVGDIEDEHDEGSIHTIVRQADGSYLADGRASLEEVATAVGPEFEPGEAGEDVDTLGGLVVTRVGRVPVRGELVPGPNGFELEVLDADPRRVKKIRIYRSTKPRDRGREPASGVAQPAGEPRNVPPAPDGQS